MSQRQERLAGEIRAILSEALIRGEIKDPRVRNAGLITITHVRLTGDLREARALFMAHGANDAKLTGVCDALNHASGYLRRIVGDKLSVRVIPTLSFEVDRVFEQSEKVDALLKEIAVKPVPVAPGSDEPPEES